jgi:hypothetical protein
MDYTLVPINSRPGAFFAIDNEDYQRFVVDMPSWALTGSTGKYLQCDWDSPLGRKRPRINRLLLLGLCEDNSIVVDHINGDTLDNRRCNLRVLRKGTNVAHRPNMNSNNTSGTRGVYWCNTNKLWYARIQHEEKEWWKKSFKNKEDAIREITKMRNTYEIIYGLTVGKKSDRIPELQKSHQIIDEWNTQHHGKISNADKPRPQARENYNQKRRDLTASARDKRKEYLLSQPQTKEVIDELLRIQADERRSQARLSGTKLTKQEQRVNFNENRRLKAAAERKAKREKLLAILEKDPDDEEAKKELKKVEKTEKLAQSKIALALKKQAYQTPNT